MLAASSALSWVTNSSQTGSGSPLPMQISLLDADGGDLPCAPPGAGLSKGDNGITE